MSHLFSRWKAAYARNLDRYKQLEAYVSEKNGKLMSRCLQEWRIELMCLQARRVFDMKLLTTLLAEWKKAARGML